MIVDTTISLDEKVCRELKDFNPDCIVSDSLSFWGKLFAQKLNESDTMQSGLKSLSSLQTFSSKEIVVSTIISINPGKSLP
ncbi:hypothetical protein ACTPD5_22865, partial [Clostridioides difficile]